MTFINYRFRKIIFLSKKILLLYHNVLQGTNQNELSAQIGQVLDPIKKGMNEMHDQLQSFAQQTENLRDRTAENLQQAGQANRAAEGAHKKAVDAQQVLV